jgi:hypothetical protein
MDKFQQYGKKYSISINYSWEKEFRQAMGTFIDSKTMGYGMESMGA